MSQNNHSIELWKRQLQLNRLAGVLLLALKRPPVIALHQPAGQPGAPTFHGIGLSPGRALALRLI
jgi:hypothetical protein